MKCMDVPEAFRNDDWTTVRTFTETVFEVAHVSVEADATILSNQEVKENAELEFGDFVFSSKLLFSPELDSNTLQLLRPYVARRVKSEFKEQIESQELGTVVETEQSKADVGDKVIITQHYQSVVESDGREDVYYSRCAIVRTDGGYRVIGNARPHEESELYKQFSEIFQKQKSLTDTAIKQVAVGDE